MPDPQAADGRPADADPGREPLTRIEPVPVLVAFEAHDTGHPWQPIAWRPSRIEPGEGDESLSIELHRDEAGGYSLNLSTDEPSIFVKWRLEPDQPRALAVTLSYDEAGRWMDGGESVDRLPMPEEMRDWLAEFVRLHHRPEGRRKRQKHRPSFMARDAFEAMVSREGQEPGSREP